MGKINWEKNINKIINFRCNDIEGKIKIIDYIKKNQKLKIKYNEKEYFIHTSCFVKCGLSNIVRRWRMKKEFKYEIGKIINNKKIINRYRKYKKDGTAGRMCDVQCTICGSVFSQFENNIDRSGCGVCENTVIYKGVNSLKKRYYGLFNIILDNDVENYGIKSSHRVNWKCNKCGNINYTMIRTLTDSVDKNRPLPCKYCNDNFSFGEKIINNVMKFVSKSYKTQKSFKWSNKRKYDVYDFINNKHIFIEVNGEQHYTESFGCVGSRTLEEEKANDKYKKHLAKINCKKVVYINIPACSYMSFDDIKKNIIRSLGNIYNLQKVDWIQVLNLSINSLIIDVCKLYNNGVSLNEISKIKNISYCTVNTYLHKGNELKLCNYIPNNSPNTKMIICLNNNKIFQSVKDAAIWSGLKNGSGISNCCMGKEGYITAGCIPNTKERCRWAYYEDFLTDKKKIEYLKNKKIYKNQYDKAA